ncbi:MAG: arsenite methyltransferase [Planctomycetota bacterium]|nr:arsenite methyltransferase [Planctomycetota bacterium]
MTNPSKSSPSPVHAEISGAYERALERSKESGSSCCGPGPASGNAAKLVDYGGDAAGLPEQAVRSSFGCGNPLAFADVQPGEVVADLGSGAGLDLLIASDKVGESGRVIGVDMTDAMLAEAQKNIERAGATNIELRKGTIEALPLDDASVDWVISNCVINLSPDKEAVFAEIARVLKPGGRVSVSDIVAEQLPAELREHAAVRSACIGGAISEAEYISGLQGAGLVDVEVTERMVYDEQQLLSVVALDDAQLEGLGEDFVRAAATATAGKVWSARFRAQRA